MRRKSLFPPPIFAQSAALSPNPAPASTYHKLCYRPTVGRPAGRLRRVARPASRRKAADAVSAAVRVACDASRAPAVLAACSPGLALGLADSRPRRVALAASIRAGLAQVLNLAPQRLKLFAQLAQLFGALPRSASVHFGAYRFCGKTRALQPQIL